MQERIVTDLDEMLSLYESNLVDKLRHFGLEADFLETWVPDADPVKSVINLVDAAIVANLQSVLEVKASCQLLNEACVKSLRDILDGVIDLEIRAVDNVVMISMSRFERPLGMRVDGFDPSDSLEHTAFKIPRRRDCFEKPSHSDKSVTVFDARSPVPFNLLYQLPAQEKYLQKKQLEVSDQSCLIEDSKDGVVLQMRIKPDAHIVEDAAFSGNVSPDLSGLLDAFCGIVIGLPIQEVSDHGVARLELNLRSPEHGPPMTGIVLAAAVDNRFHVIESLVRHILTRYRQLTGYQDTQNEYDVPPAASWLARSDQERSDLINCVLSRKLQEIGYDSTNIELVNVEFNVRVLVRFRDRLAEESVDKQAVLIALETAMMDSIEPRLELYLEPVSDQSQLRRLTE